MHGTPIYVRENGKVVAKKPSVFDECHRSRRTAVDLSKL